MKKMILTLALIAASVVTAQTNKVTNPYYASSTTSNSYSQAENEMTALLGFTNGAANVGVDYARMMDGVGYGGYFLLQTEKKPVIRQVMSFGGLLKFNIADKNKFSASMSPGFGIHMFKDIGTSDETALGLVFKIAAQYKITSEFALGLESTTITNMFSDKAPGLEQVYSIAGSFGF